MGMFWVVSRALTGRHGDVVIAADQWRELRKRTGPFEGRKVILAFRNTKISTAVMCLEGDDL